MWNESPLATIRFRQGPFARPALPGFVATMNPSDSQRGRLLVMNSRHPLVAARPSRRPATPGLSGSWSICRRPPSSITPEGPIAAYARGFTTGVGFIPPGGMATLDCVTRPNQVHLRYG